MAEKLTRWQKAMKNAGFQIIPFTHEEIMDHLIEVFNRDKEHFLKIANQDNTGRKKLIFVLDYHNVGDKNTIFGGTVVYNKKLKKFTTITYSDEHNWGVIFSIESKIAFFAYDFYQPLKAIFPCGCGLKTLKEYLLSPAVDVEKMRVYIEPIVDYGWYWGASCKMIADNQDELHAFARLIGLKRSWFHEGSKTELPHYKISGNKRKMALKKGAIEISTLEIKKRIDEYITSL